MCLAATLLEIYVSKTSKSGFYRYFLMIFSIPVGQNVPGTTKSVQQLIAKGVWSFRVLSSNRTGASRLQPGLIKTDRYRAAGHRGVPA